MSKKNSNTNGRNSAIFEGGGGTLDETDTSAMALMQASDSAGGDPPAPVTPAAEPPAPVVPAAEGAKAADGQQKAEGEQSSEKKGMVPHQALHEEREERKKADKRAEEAAALLTKTTERFEQVLKAFAPKEPPAPAAPQAPDPETDPVGYVKFETERTGKTVEAVQAELKTMKEQKASEDESRKNTDALSMVVNTAISKEAEFRTANPEYDQAANFFVQNRTEDLKEMGYNDDQVGAIINQERLVMAMQALSQNKNPAEILFKMAKRAGFVAKAPDAKPGAAAAVATDPPAPAAPAPTAAESLAVLAAGKGASASLSEMGGSAPVPLTAARLAEMSDAEFDRVMNTKEGRALFGQ